ncbi:MAG: carbohydrate ABC transporter permease [Acholeplasmatales bacterium]|jgi:ABC-type glycerol-3-phosphate transport system permease component|nr:carbohydrate ABC transporter permease [Acholeplasmataceae bacterium]MDY0115002.1 carbohydrate ABC transporter permease [Acholeplasmatales bacterium]MCK9233780.1 carbohydrate ABC transporter permease [Acholeplasmataceae bacterium]MCK9289003.1 carbohydrate ABC transporter permease [Acholeplasmataceae bacterium]MCK9427860.1 carbohydrate ABC transporter permease [Acholeplasmataceae bacterium]
MEKKNIQELKLSLAKRKLVKRGKRGKKRISRSWQGDVVLIVFLLAFGAFSAYPLVFTIANAFKPLNEMFIFPPKLLPRNFTFDNFRDLFNLIGNTRIPLSKYFFNTIFITVLGVSGHVFIAALAAYPLAKHRFPGRSVINQLIVYSLMFSSVVTSISNYLIISKLGLIDSPWAIIIPSWGFTLGLFLMRQFMTTIPTELLEAAKMDGAGEYRTFFTVVMPLVKPAWLTVVILLFQQLWSTDGAGYIFKENLKPLSYALSQIVAGGIARTGTSAAVAFLMLLVPITVFIINQTKIIDTMAYSGIK